MQNAVQWWLLSFTQFWYWYLRITKNCLLVDINLTMKHVACANIFYDKDVRSAADLTACYDNAVSILTQTYLCRFWTECCYLSHDNMPNAEKQSFSSTTSLNIDQKRSESAFQNTSSPALDLSPCVRPRQNRTLSSPWVASRRWPAVPLTRTRRRTKALSCWAALAAAPPACCRRITMETRTGLNPTGSQSTGQQRCFYSEWTADTPPSHTHTHPGFYPLLITRWTNPTKGSPPRVVSVIVSVSLLQFHVTQIY